jgi:hypothetical protein
VRLTAPAGAPIFASEQAAAGLCRSGRQFIW